MGMEDYDLSIGTAKAVGGLLKKGSDEIFGKAEAERGRKSETKRKAKEKSALDTKRDADKKDTDDIEKEGKRHASTVTKANTETQAALDRADTDTNKITKEFQKKQKDIDKATSDLSQKRLEDTEKLSKWYEGIASSYEDIGKRYQDAVVGLSQGEEQQMRGTAQQDFAAMSAMGSQGMAASMKGGVVGGNQMAIMAAASQRSASDSYSSAMGRMDDIDQQRREMQFNIVQQSSSDEMRNRAAGYEMQAGQSDRQFEAGQYGISQQERSSANMYQSGMTQVDSDVNNAYGRSDLTKESSAAQHSANTYGSQVGIQMRSGEYQEGKALNAASDARLEEQRAARAGYYGMAVGVAGEGAKAYAGA